MARRTQPGRDERTRIAESSLGEARAGRSNAPGAIRLTAPRHIHSMRQIMLTQTKVPDLTLVESPPDPDGARKPRRLSDILQEIADAPAAPDERISLGDLIEGFGNRAFGALLFIFAVPVALPIAIPGISAVLGAPLLFLSWQLMRGREQPWLPEVMRSRSFRRADFARMLQRVLALDPARGTSGRPTTDLVDEQTRRAGHRALCLGARSGPFPADPLRKYRSSPGHRDLGAGGSGAGRGCGNCGDAWSALRELPWSQVSSLVW